MGGASVKLRELLSPADTVTPAEGVDDFHALVPVAEPVSAGAPPVAPDLVREISAAQGVRSLRSASQHRITAGLDVARRVRVSLAWSGLSRAQAEAVRAFLDEDCGGGLNGFDVDLDGSGDLATVLATGAAEIRQVSAGVGGGDGLGVWSISVEAVHTV